MDGSAGRIDRALRNVPAIAVGTLCGGRSEVTAYGSIADERDPAALCWEIGSITKVLTGILLAEMSIRGDVGLGDPIGRFLPESVASRLPSPERQPTLAALATHTAGLPRLPLAMVRKVGRSPDPYGGLTEDDIWLHLGSDTRRPSRPRLRYSNYGMGLLGHLLGRAAGESYETLLRARVIDPLGLSATGVGECWGRRGVVPGFRKRKPAPAWTFGAMQGAGAVRSTIGDMLGFAAACIDPPSGTIGEALELAAAVHFRGKLLTAGLGWMHRSNRSGKPSNVIWHNGGTYGAASFLAVDRERRTAAVAFGNRGPRLTSPIDRVGWSTFDGLASC